MNNKFFRTEMIIGKEALSKLNKAKVAIFGVGGVGSFVCEGLVRAGVENFILVDHDIISETNINRQIHATTKTVGQYKVDVMKQRMLEINPDAKIDVYKQFFMSQDSYGYSDDDLEYVKFDSSISYIVDAIDTVSSKIELVVQANRLNIPIISAMGTGNKIEPTMLEVTDIYKTSVCPLAKVMRKELRKRGVEHLKVVYSKEEPKPIFKSEEYEKELIETGKKSIPGSMSFVPSVAGMILASEVVKGIIS